MRIAILSCFYPFRGGISQFNTYLLKELSKKHTVKAFNFTRQYPAFLFPGKTQLVAKEDTAVSIQSEAVLDTANPFSYFTSARKIASWKPDLLLTRYWMSYFAPSLGTTASRVASILKKQAAKNGETFRFRHISIVDNLLPHERHFFDKPFTRYFLNRTDGFITLSNSVKEELLDFYPNAACENIPHPLYTNFGSPVDKLSARRTLLGDSFSDQELSQRKVLLFFGLIRDYKGLDILLEAMPALDDSYTLIVAGEPYGSFEKYQKIIESERFAKVRKNLILRTDYIPDSEVKIYFSASDVSVLPYRTATQSGISSISWHFEVPLITTPVGSLPEAVGEAGTGLLTENVTPEAVAKAIKEYFAQDNAEQYVSNIRRLKQELSWENFCKQLEKFNDRLI